MNRKTALRALRRIVGVPKQLYDVEANRVNEGRVCVRLTKKLHSSVGSNKLVLQVHAKTYSEAVQLFQRRYES